jgi:tetratricopeptide (TPR) repeat protein
MTIYERIVARWRRAGVVAIVILLAGVTGFAADIAGGFDAANRLYEQGKFAEAASAYEQLVQSGKVSSALYFNLGNAFFKSGQAGRAVAAYRVAQRIAPRDPDVRANLQFARERIKGPVISTTFLQRALTALTLNEWAALAAIVLWLWLGLLVLIQFRPDLKPSVRNFIWIGGVVTIVAFGCLAAAWPLHSAETAIVVVKDAAIHNGPLEESPSDTTVHDGVEMSVLDTENDWLQVQVGSQRVGWVKRDQVLVASGT